MEDQSTFHGQNPRTDSISGTSPRKNLNFKPKIVVIMGATGAGKSKLAVDLATHFRVEIVNADSMQVYQGLDVLTNKVPVHEQKGVPHHLLGTISPDVEFTAKNFRDTATHIINGIWSRKRLPVIVGGTNYYIQALVSRFLLDDHVEDLETKCLLNLPGENKQSDSEIDSISESRDNTYSRLKDLDPAAANRIHPNDQRKINQYLNIYSRLGVAPSELFQGNSMENWGRADNLRYDCCFICVDASLPELDKYVNDRVDIMVSNGLLEEVYDIYKSNADYTRGLRQAIGVREFEDFLECWNKKCTQSNSSPELLKQEIHRIMDSSGEDRMKLMLIEAIEKVKLNTRRLVRRQRRRLSRLQLLFGWNIRNIDVTNYLSCPSDDLWSEKVVKPSAETIESFLHEKFSSAETEIISLERKLSQRDLWTRYVCQACNNKELRGSHEWEQHKRGRSHRKRVSSLKKSGADSSLGSNLQNY